MANNDIRAEIKGAGLKMWQVADNLGVTDCSFSRMLRYELSDSRKAEILAIISRLSREGKENGKLERAASNEPAGSNSGSTIGALSSIEAQAEQTAGVPWLYALPC